MNREREERIGTTVIHPTILNTISSAPMTAVSTTINRRRIPAANIDNLYTLSNIVRPVSTFNPREVVWLYFIDGKGSCGKESGSFKDSLHGLLSQRLPYFIPCLSNSLPPLPSVVYIGAQDMDSVGG